MSMEMHNLFIDARYDAGTGLIHAAACLYDETGTPCGRVTMSQAAKMPRSGFDLDHAAGLAAFEAGCLMAKQAGARRLLLHAPDDVDHDVMYRAREDKSMALDDDGGADYFDMGVFIYRPGDGAEKSEWQQAAWRKVQSIASMLAAAVPEAAL